MSAFIIIIIFVATRSMTNIFLLYLGENKWQ